MSETEFREWLHKKVRNEHLDQKRAAEWWGISPQYLSDVLRGRREPGEKLLKEVGYRRVVTYQEVIK